MTQNTSVTVKMAFIILIFFAAFTTGGVLLGLVTGWFNPIIYVIGLSIGTSTSFIRLTMLHFSVGKFLEMPTNSARIFASVSYFLRYFVMIGIMVGAGILHLNGMANIYAAILGMLFLQPAAYIIGFFDKTRSKFKKIKEGNGIESDAKPIQ
jgi:hypothetical protein